MNSKVFDIVMCCRMPLWGLYFVGNGNDLTWMGKTP